MYKLLKYHLIPVWIILHISCSLHFICGVVVFVLGQDKGYRVKYSAPPEGVPKGKAQKWRALFDRVSQVDLFYGQYNILKIYYPNDSPFNLIHN